MKSKLIVALGALAFLVSCASVPPANPERCAQLQIAADEVCAQNADSQECRALKLAYASFGCGTYVPPKPEPCPSCEPGYQCTDPAKGCVLIPVADPTPVCEPNQDCNCWVKPPETAAWTYLTCGAGKVCENFQCRVIPPSCPTCPAGQECKDPAVGCKPSAGAFPQGLEDSEYTAVASVPSLHELVNSAITEVTGCQPGSTCLTNDTPVGFMWRVTSKLREKGYAAGRHIDDNTCATCGTDEITVRKPGATCEWEGYHVVFYGVPNTVVWAMPRSSPCHGHQCSGGGSYRGNFVIPASYCASPAPLPPPPGGFVPPPDQSYGCPSPQPPRVWTAENLPPGWSEAEIGKPDWFLKSGPHQDYIDTTALITRNEPYCASIGMSPMADGTPRASCPMRPECGADAPANAICHDRIACERYVAEGDWVLNSRNGAVCVARSDNSAQFYRNNGNCQLCNPAKTVCTDWY